MCVLNVEGGRMEKRDVCLGEGGGVVFGSSAASLPPSLHHFFFSL